MPQIFGCPYCQNPFGVPDNAAGQTFECPSCDKPVEVPDLSAPEPEVYRCPHCAGKFGIDSSMYGQQLACPHCANHVVIGEQPTPSPPPRVEEVFDVVIEDDPVFPPMVPPKKFSKSPPKKTPSKKTPSGNSPSTKGTPKRTSKREAKGPAGEQPVTSRQKAPSKKPGKTRRKTKSPQEFGEKASPVEKPSSLADSSARTSRKVEDSQAIESSSSRAGSLGATSTLEPRSVAHLLPPPFDVPDPIRFPHKIGANEVLLPDGQGGYQAAEANVVTITYEGKVYHLQRLTPDERRKRQLIHNAVAILIAVLLLFLTLQTIGIFS